MTSYDDTIFIAGAALGIIMGMVSMVLLFALGSWVRHRNEQ